MEPWEDVIAKPNRTETQLVSADSCANEFLRIVLILAKV
jgi:hypothetical protein